MKPLVTPQLVKGLDPEQVYQLLSTFHNGYIDDILDWFQENEPKAYQRYLNHLEKEGY